jgi:NDP-sugar pyrophosphorylase family protein
MNYAQATREPCSRCVLMELVPAESRWEKVPCRHIPLNMAGETIDYFYQCGTPEELEKAMESWLRQTIEYLEKEQARSNGSSVAESSNTPDLHKAESGRR